MDNWNGNRSIGGVLPHAASNWRHRIIATPAICIRRCALTTSPLHGVLFFTEFMLNNKCYLRCIQTRAKIRQ
jgi:hypothetical protein